MELGALTPVNSVITPSGVMRRKFVHCLLGEPHVPIRASGNVARKRIWRGRPEFSEPAGRELVTPHGMIGLVGKPDVAIGTRW